MKHTVFGGAISEWPATSISRSRTDTVRRFSIFHGLCAVLLLYPTNAFQHSSPPLSIINYICVMLA